MAKRTNKPASKSGSSKSSSWTLYLPWLGTLIALVLALKWYRQQPTIALKLSASQSLKGEFIPVTCASRPGRGTYEGCSPTQCGRYVEDNFATPDEIAALRTIVDKALSYGGSSSGTNVFDVASGAVSWGDRFLDVYQSVKTAHQKDPTKPESLFTSSEADLLDSIYQRIEKRLKERFAIAGQVYLTRPSFFSKISGEGKAKTVNDEYWHDHVDTEQYGTFDYTGLIYLSTFGSDFTGGEFTFLDTDPKTGNKTLQTVVEPKAGRLSLFTSAHENLHRVEKAKSGTRMAFTVAFACNPENHAKDITKKGRLGILNTEQ